MINKVYKLKISILIILKCLIFLAFCSSFIIIARINYPFNKFFSINLGTTGSTYSVLFLVFGYIYDGFKLGENKISDSLYSLNLAGLMALIFTYFQLCILFNTWFLNPIPFLIAAISNVAISLISSISFTYFYDKFYPPKNTVIVYSDKTNINSLMAKINNRPDKYIVKNLIYMNQNLNTVFNIIKDCDLVILCQLEPQYRKKIIHYCYKKTISVIFLPSVSDIIIHKSEFNQIVDLPFLTCYFKGLSIEQKIIKRIIDLIIGSFILTLTFPIWTIAAIFIKLYDGGPIIFSQQRVTINNKVFNLYKFRSMIINAEQDGIARLASKNDKRITPIGKIIRMLRIDELPQIINILKGDMSIVGPRPERPEIIQQYIIEHPSFEYRTKVKAGITGFAQIHGRYNTPPIDKLIMDLMYIESYSVLLDLKLMFQTIKVIFIPESSQGL